MWKRVAIALLISLVSVLGTLTFVYATGAFSPQDFDKNSNRHIEWSEAQDAARAYFRGEITQAEALEILLYYTGGVRVSTTTLLPTPTPPTSSGNYWTPTSNPAPTLFPPPERVTLELSTTRIQVNWEYDEPGVTRFEIAYKVGNRAWQTRYSFTRGSGGMSFPADGLTPGARVDVWVGAANADRGGQWGKTYGIVPRPRPIPTSTPEPTFTPVPTPYSNAYNLGCFHKPRLTTSQPSDIRLAATFRNPPRLQRDPWEAPKDPIFSYGFMLREVEGNALFVRVSSDAKWVLQLRYKAVARSILGHSRGRWVHTLASGTLYNFDARPLAHNHLMFEAVGSSYRFAVNGRLLPLTIDAADRAAIEALIGEYRYYETGQWHGYYGATYRSGSMDMDSTSVSDRRDLVAGAGGYYTTVERDITSASGWSSVRHRLPVAACQP